MNLINQNSLGVTLENFYSYYYSGRKISSSEKKKLAEWLASRQGIERSYAGMIAPTLYDYKHGVRLFSGEKIDMAASIGHITGEEALRVLYLLGGKGSEVKKAIKKCRNGLNESVKRHMNLGYYPNGFYCCGKCTAAYWRNLSAESVKKNKATLNAGLKVLKRMRDGKGKWKRFPFHYTVLSLIGIDLPSAKEELKYAAKSLERIAKRAGKGKYGKRREMIAEIALLKLLDKW